MPNGWVSNTADSVSLNSGRWQRVIRSGDAPPAPNGYLTARLGADARPISANAQSVPFPAVERGSL
jgi:hypothetical protein